MTRSILTPAILVTLAGAAPAAPPKSVVLIAGAPDASHPKGTPESERAARHPILRGVGPYRVREEFYYQLRFRPNDRRLKPVLRAEIPGAGEQTVGWAVERADGGRGFGYTGGHFSDNWRVPEHRRAVLNALVWAARGEVPAGGVASKLPGGEADVPSADPAWTPKAPAGANAPAWQKDTDADWVD